MSRGEVVMGAGFGALGAGWLLLSLDLDYMGDFAPGAGFLPVWLSAALVVLSAWFVVKRLAAGAWRSSPPPGTVDPAWKRPLAVAVGLLVCVAVIETLGFVPAVTLYLLYLVRVVERYRWRTAAALALGTAVGLWLLFSVWLSVPLPVGPLGF